MYLYFAYYRIMCKINIRHEVDSVIQGITYCIAFKCSRKLNLADMAKFSSCESLVMMSP